LQFQEEPDDKPGTQAYAFLKKFCADCHTAEKPKSEVKDYDVLNYASLTKKRADNKGAALFYVKAGSKGKAGLDDSLLWLMVSDKDMPPEKFDKKEVKPIPSDKEREIIKKWIEAGAPKGGFGPADKGK